MNNTYEKEIKRKWLVHKDKLPNLLQFNFCEYKYAYLSQPNDSLEVRAESIGGKGFNIVMKDKGTKTRNKIMYNITEEEFEVSYVLGGKKIISKRVYDIPSTVDPNIVFKLNIYQDTGLMIVEAGDQNETVIDSVITEPWFGEEVTYEAEFKSSSIAYKNAYGN